MWTDLAGKRGIEHHSLNPSPKQSFKLPANPLKSPRVADEWEPYLAEKRADHTRLTLFIAEEVEHLSAADRWLRPISVLRPFRGRTAPDREPVKRGKWA
jgi:hypothetical protein